MSLESIPTYFSDFMGIPLVAGQAILSLFMILAVMIPTFYLAKGHSNIVPIMIFFLVEIVLVGLGWLSFWILIATLVLMAGAFSRFATGSILG